MAGIYKQDYFGFVYLWYDTKHKKFIIGSHHGSIHDGYTTSTGGVHVKRIFNARPETMKRKILAYNPVDCLKATKDLEQRYLDMRPSIGDNPKYYNINPNAVGGVGGWGHVNSDPDRVNPMKRPEVREAHAQRMRDIVEQDPHYFCRHAIGDNSPMRRPEVLARHPALFSSENNPMLDPEVKRKNKETQTRLSGKPVSVCGVSYPSLREAARQIGFSSQKLRYRIKSDNYKDHFWLEEK
jgi:hypothetical protein